MKDVVLNEVTEELKWKDKVFILCFKKMCVKIYKKGIEKGVNAVL